MGWGLARSCVYLYVYYVHICLYSYVCIYVRMYIRQETEKERERDGQKEIIVALALKTDRAPPMWVRSLRSYQGAAVCWVKENERKR